MTEIPYHFHRNLHSLAGARAGLAEILSGLQVSSVLDVGAGIGTWLRAAEELGILDIAGIDGLRAEPSEIQVRPGAIQKFDLAKPVRLERRFDLVLCLEVAEHLDQSAAATLIETLCAHSDLIFFSAAAPGQHGEHHVNCQWPTYWQDLFNARGYVCRDDLRSRIWANDAIEPWYRQNIFSASRDCETAGKELRLRHLIHPDMTRHMDFPDSPLARRQFDQSQGKYPPLHYVRLLGRSLARRVPGASANA
jgi:SAM-dependent methyltransferase